MADETGTNKYTPDRKGLMLKYGSIAATGIIAGGSLISLSACSNRKDQWAETSGKAGQINMEAVEDAMKKSENVSEFEKRVNEIYQGEEMVLVEVKNQGREQLVSGYADLNNDSQIDGEDEKLFTFRRWYEGEKPNYSMRGYGVNSYYYHPYPSGTSMLTTYLLWSALSRHTSPTYIYHTTVRDAGVLRNHRTNYRTTPSYKNQVNANRSFQTRMSTKHGTSYRKASPTATRQRWATRKGVNLQKATSASKSTTSRRSSSSKSRSWGSRVSRGFRGAATGGGIGPLYRRTLT